MAGTDIFTSGAFTPAPPVARLTPADIQGQFDDVNRQRRLLDYAVLVRPFLSPDAGKLLLDQILKKRNKPGTPTAASITWGQASSFAIDAQVTPFLSSLDQGQDTKKNPLGTTTTVFTEISRTTTKVRVEQQDNAENYVEIERIDTITFSGPDGINREFVLHWS